MRKIWLSLVVLSLVMSTSLMAQKRDDARSIDRLKKTHVDQLEDGLPQENFAAWFAGLVKPEETGYEVQECPNYNPAGGITEQLLCVVAYTKPSKPGWRRWIELWFIIGAKPTQEEAKDTEAKHVAYLFIRGTENPGDPRMARPSRKISKLSDLENMLRGSTNR